MQRRLVGLHLAVRRGQAAVVRRAADDRGDVPGWVLVTIMTAGLVAALWAVAGSRLTGMFDEAMNQVVGGP